MSGHTPGPWSLSWISGAIRHINRNVDSDCFWFPDEGEDTDTANHPSRNQWDYHLIAAAPELLDLLKKMEAAGVFKGEWANYVDEAIKKAEGAR